MNNGPSITMMLHEVTGMTILGRSAMVDGKLHIFTKLVFHGEGGVQEIDVFHGDESLKIEDNRGPS